MLLLATDKCDLVHEGCLLVKLASVVCVPAFKMIKLKIVLSVRAGRYIFLIHLIIFKISLNIYIFAPIGLKPQRNHSIYLIAVKQMFKLKTCKNVDKMLYLNGHKTRKDSKTSLMTHPLGNIMANQKCILIIIIFTILFIFCVCLCLP